MIGETRALTALLPQIAPEGARGGPREAAEQFEVLFIKQVLSQMPMAGLENTQAGTFMSMFQEALAEKIVAGGGLGLADQLERAFEGGIAPQAPPARATPRKPERTEVRISSGFGDRRDPIDGTHKRHSGLDIAAPEGSAIRAAMSGTVRFAGESKGYGNLVIIEHEDGLETRYAHCKSLDVREGDTVASGQVIASVGETGRATGPHLHFEVRQDGVAADPLSRFDSPQQLVETIRGVVRDQDGSLLEGAP